MMMFSGRPKFRPGNLFIFYLLFDFMGLFNKISAQEKINFAKNLGVMLKSGVTINDAIALLVDQAKSRSFKRMIHRVKGGVEKGIPLSESFAKEEDKLGGVFVGLLRAGEMSGTLEGNLLFLADWLERNDDLRQEIKAATIYPKFVLAATLLLGGALSVYILPKLVPFFSQLRVELPLPTKVLLAFSLFVEQFWYLVLLGVVASVILFLLLNRVKFIKRFLHSAYIKIPFIGNLIVYYQLAIISQLFATLLKSGFSISESIETTSRVATNIRYQESLEKIRGRLNKGTGLSGAMSEYPKLYPQNLISMVATGEKSGTLENSLMYLSEFYTKEVRRKTKKLPTFIEPILLIFMAVIIGFVALSIIMPIYELTSSIGR